MRRILFLIVTTATLCFVPTAQAQDIGDPSDLVTHWYQAYLGRAPDPSGAAYWVDQLRQGKDPNVVLSTLLASDEYYQRAGSTPQGYVTQMCVDLLGRAPTSTELDFWSRKLYGDSRQDVAYQLLTQNAGAWVGTYRLPAVDRDHWYRDHDRWYQDRDRSHDREREEFLRREREREHERERDRHDYRRPGEPIRH